ncbi:sugar ABC transporter permease [Sphaerisporangium krabiense]|uniref:ABC-type glycerol-3-phosphate transport system permease component n=1 Tax=Sphaerisporangium krabiense TaxID=763782 RepID=A0A7W8Z0C6_9ACTN|nr:carbohydrate ABC transporter permease [Sphaerisporangium krabiense]MBB5625061.1 ABC-type glycerol-3-phosphate transport system permease component [Sphaerisporangium krabiense]GII67515.1 sugar ABC transporter permease [Sphaerisporangium krabiense]
MGKTLSPLVRAFVWLWVVSNVLLFVWIAFTSLKSSGEVFGSPFKLPASPRWPNYESAWSVSEMGQGFFNSVVIVTTASVTTIVLAAPTAYMLTRSGTRTAGPLTTFFAVGMGIPIQAMIVPVFILMQKISMTFNDAFGWWDDRISLSAIYVATSLPFAIFLLTSFFRTLPTEIEEAAALDGAGGARIFAQIMLPLAQPGLITAFILTVISLWNETLLALMLITDTEQYTLPQALLGLYQTMQYTSNWGGLFAGVIIVILPIIAVYIWLSRRIMEGMTLGAGK